MRSRTRSEWFSFALNNRSVAGNPAGEHVHGFTLPPGKTVKRFDVAFVVYVAPAALLLLLLIPGGGFVDFKKS